MLVFKVPPHIAFVTEMEMMFELGMEVRDVILAATCNAAIYLGLEDEIGTIEK